MHPAASGSANVIASMRDGSSETVMVIWVPQRQLSDYVAVVDNEAASIAFCCGKPVEWTDNLTDESFLQLLEVSRSINLKRALHWAERELKYLRGVFPQAAQAAELARVAVELNGRIGSALGPN